MITQPTTSASPGSENATQRPTRAARDLLLKLATLTPAGWAYAAHMPRGRMVLVTQQAGAPAGSMIGVGVYNMDTLRTAAGRRWLIWGDYVATNDMPAFDRDPRPLKSGGGYVVTITDDGRAVIGRPT